MTAVALSFCSHTTYPIFLRKNLLLRKLRKIFFVSVSLSEIPPIPSPPHVNHTLSVLADSGVSSYSGINAEFSESLDGRKKFGKISFPPKNSSEFCTHRLTRARLPTFVVASLTALGFFTRKLRTPKLGRVGRAQARAHAAP